MYLCIILQYAGKKSGIQKKVSVLQLKDLIWMTGLKYEVN